eukprot:TRINITY_DN10806_c0_g1_i1.p1 TRINITY_DN10806_c0_g1~~TRINITY_DN10806_c0_g1_i1.p1  ORF type:complete len:673 (+),score=86.63 TRINITY_DN10806_c0_g1_i1:488-2506(+)
MSRVRFTGDIKDTEGNVASRGRRETEDDGPLAGPTRHVAIFPEQSPVAGSTGTPRGIKEKLAAARGRLHKAFDVGKLRRDSEDEDKPSWMEKQKGLADSEAMRISVMRKLQALIKKKEEDEKAGIKYTEPEDSDLAPIQPQERKLQLIAPAGGSSGFSTDKLIALAEETANRSERVKLLQSKLSGVKARARARFLQNNQVLVDKIAAAANGEVSTDDSSASVPFNRPTPGREPIHRTESDPVIPPNTAHPNVGQAASMMELPVVMGTGTAEELSSQGGSSGQHLGVGGGSGHIEVVTRPERRGHQRSITSSRNHSREPSRDVSRDVSRSASRDGSRQDLTAEEQDRGPPADSEGKGAHEGDGEHVYQRGIHHVPVLSLGSVPIDLSSVGQHRSTRQASYRRHFYRRGPGRSRDISPVASDHDSLAVGVPDNESISPAISPRNMSPNSARAVRPLPQTEDYSHSSGSLSARDPPRTVGVIRHLLAPVPPTQRHNNGAGVPTITRSANVSPIMGRANPAGATRGTSALTAIGSTDGAGESQSQASARADLSNAGNPALHGDFQSIPLDSFPRSSSFPEQLNQQTFAPHLGRNGQVVRLPPVRGQDKSRGAGRRDLYRGAAANEILAHRTVLNDRRRLNQLHSAKMGELEFRALENQLDPILVNALRAGKQKRNT